MIIYPAIDIREGKCVRLVQGKAQQQTVYSQDPVEVALQWKDKGARFLHVVDLDGAFEGQSRNENIIREIVKKTNIPVQVGGGIRSLDRMAYFLEKAGAARVVLGTVAIQNPALIEQAVKHFGKAIAVGIDVKNNRVAIKGWVEESDITPVELGIKLKELGVETAIFTDILCDGMLKGPNIESTREMMEKTGLSIIASGGVSSIEHIAQLKSIGVAGVIIGKALYSGRIDLKQALDFEDK